MKNLTCGEQEGAYLMEHCAFFNAFQQIFVGDRTILAEKYFTLIRSGKLFCQSVIFPKHHPKKSTSAIYLKAADVATVKCVKSFHGMKICCPLKNLIKFFKSNSR